MKLSIMTLSIITLGLNLKSYMRKVTKDKNGATTLSITILNIITRP